MAFKKETDNTTVEADVVQPSVAETESTEETTPLSYEDRIAEANKTIKNHMMVSLGFGVVPVPMVDLVGITGTQLNMLRSLSELYGQEFKKDWGKKAIGSLLGGGVSIPLAMGLSSLIKSIPVVGQAAGALSMATSGAALTYAVGRVFVSHFESGGTFLTFDPAQMKEHFKAEFEAGKDVAKDIEQSGKVSA
jgi:uncharacterized protein (DUF697 family)